MLHKFWSALLGATGVLISPKSVLNDARKAQQINPHMLALHLYQSFGFTLLFRNLLPEAVKSIADRALEATTNEIYKILSVARGQPVDFVESAPWHASRVILYEHHLLKELRRTIATPRRSDEAKNARDSIRRILEADFPAPKGDFDDQVTWITPHMFVELLQRRGVISKSIDDSSVLLDAIVEHLEQQERAFEAEGLSLLAACHGFTVLELSRMRDEEGRIFG